MFAIVGSTNFKNCLDRYDDDVLPPYYPDAMCPELYTDKDIAEDMLFRKVIELPEQYNNKLHRVEKYEGTSNTVLLDKHGKVKCLYGFDRFIKMPFGCVETHYLYKTYRLLEI